MEEVGDKTLRKLIMTRRVVVDEEVRGRGLGVWGWGGGLCVQVGRGDAAMEELGIKA
jgi:hypothetical protein